MTVNGNEDHLLREVALQTANTIHLARARAEDELRKQTEWLRVTLASIGDAVISTDADCNVTFLNAVAEKLTGWSMADAIGHPLDQIFKIICPATRQPAENPAQRALQAGTVVGLANHTVLVAKNGSELDIDDSAAPIRDQAGNSIGVVLVFRDVSERRMSERALQESEARKSAMFETALDCIISIDHLGRIIEYNAAAERTFGYPRSAVVGREMSELIIPPALRERHREGLARYLATGQESVVNQRIEMPALRADGSEFLVELTITRIVASGPPIFTAYLRDITERYQAEQARTEQYSLIALRAMVSSALASMNDTQDVLQQCTAAIVQHLDMALARIWTVDETGDTLILQASAGQFTQLDGPHSRIKVGEVEIGRIAKHRQSHLTNDVQNDPNISDPQWAKDQGMAAFAGYPILVGARVVGVLAMFARRPLSDVVLTDLAPLAEVIGQYIERKQVETALSASEERVRLALDSAELGSWHVNPATMKLTTDSRFRTIFGVTSDQLEYEQAIALVHADDQERVREAVAESTRPDNPQPYSVEYRVLQPDGSVRWVAAKGRANFENRGSHRQLKSFDGTLADITEQRKVQEDLRNAATRLSDADQRKDEFLATLAHELRNPLAPIRAGLEVMKLAKDDPEAMEEIRSTMARQVSQMVRLIDDLLDVSRITQGKLDLRTCRVAIVDVIQSAVEATQPFIDEANHQLIVTTPLEPIFLNADPNRLAQVLSNLLNNSAKYTPEGGCIWLTADREGEDIVVTVKDNGIGIPTELQGGIFEMFSQIDRSLEKGYKGLGIGLTLVKRLVGMHGGTIDVRSDGTDLGSEFTVRLPILPENESEPKPSAAPAAKATRLRVLVVDDNSDAANMLSLVVKMLGFEVRLANDGLQAIQMAEEFMPHAVLMDIGMPRMNGYEAASRIRQNSWGKNMVLVALTGWGQDEDKQRALDAGFNHHLVKPADPSDLQRIFADMRL